MHHPATLAVVALFLFVVVCLLAVKLAEGKPVDEDPGSALAPEPRFDLKWWAQRHEQKLAAKAKALELGNEIELVFVGDSITHGWERAGKRLWAERFAPYGALNLGYSGDRTEHVLWRLGVDASAPEGEEDAHNEILGLAPKLFVVMIGTNNTGHRMDPAEETAAGITAIVDRLHTESPESHVLLLGVFPRSAAPTDPQRLRNVAINQQIASLGERGEVTFLDIADVFLDDKGQLPKSVMPDHLHPNKKGYVLWADAIREEVERHLGPLP